MNEQEWLASTDPETMLDHLHGKASDRKHRLFACACCRHIWHLMTDGRSRASVEVAERYADGRATKDELAAARAAAEAAARDADKEVDREAARAAARAVIWATGVATVASAARSATWNAVGAAAGKAAWRVVRRAELKTQADLLRDIFGNPWRPVIRQYGPSPLKEIAAGTWRRPVGIILDDWLAWNDGTISRLAQAMYDRRNFSDMPVLGDALEEAGCDSADILNHCRQTGEHVRGCWVVDLILGKG